MNTTQLVVAFLGSAAVGALISSGVTAVAQWRERVARREELIFTEAIKMAHVRFTNVMQILKDTQQSGKIVPEIYMAHVYYCSLLSLFKTGELDDRMKETLRKQGIDLTKFDD